MDLLNENIINQIHSYFFDKNVITPSDDEIIDMYIKNKEILKLPKNVKYNELIDKVIRIKSEYCYALSNKGRFHELNIFINEPINMLESLYKENNLILDNIFYEQLIFHRMVSNFKLNNLNLAKIDIDKLVKNFPNNEVYENWDKFIKKKNNTNNILSKIKKIFIK